MRTTPALRSQYSNRLNRIREELALALASVDYIRANLDRPEIRSLPGFALVKRAALVGTADRLEDTYFIRLTAEFEGILKEYLNEYQPATVIPDAANFDWLISRVFRPKKIVPPTLRAQIDATRKYRNAIAHSGEKPPRILFAQALQRLNLLLRLLPEPPI